MPATKSAQLVRYLVVASTFMAFGWLLGVSRACSHKEKADWRRDVTVFCGQGDLRDRYRRYRPVAVTTLVDGKPQTQRWETPEPDILTWQINIGTPGVDGDLVQIWAVEIDRYVP